jgi:predicted dehydrogenase
MRTRLRWGLIGGGLGSQIGDAHRIAARMDDLFTLSAAALDVDPAKGKAYAVELGITDDRAYGNWRDMFEGERGRADRVDLVTVATPNVTHYEITRTFLGAGFDVLCEKPLTLDVAQAEDLVRIAAQHRRVCAVNFGFSGYPMVRQARAMVRAGDLGRIRVVVAEFAHGFHYDANDADNPRIRWRYDPKQAGGSAVLADAGIHALHMACYVLGQSIDELTAHFHSNIAGRQLEDDALLAIRFSGGTVGRLWTSAVAIGQMHGLNIRIFGEKGGLRWHQEQPNQLVWTPAALYPRTLERGGDGLYPAAARGSRIAVGHAEGMLEAFGNIYRDLYVAITTAQSGELSAAFDDPPAVEAGLEMVRAVHAAIASAKNGGRWTKLRD